MFRFTIRDLFWLTVVVALGVGWIVATVRNAHRVKNLEAKIEQLEFAIKREDYSLSEDQFGPFLQDERDAPRINMLDYMHNPRAPQPKLPSD